MTIKHIYQLPYEVSSNSLSFGWNILFNHVHNGIAISMEEYHCDNNITSCRGSILIPELCIYIEKYFTYNTTIKQLEWILLNKLNKVLFKEEDDK